MNLRCAILLATLPTLATFGQEPAKPSEPPASDPHVLFPVVGLKIQCPKGFTNADKFHGFMLLEKAASIMLVRMAGPYSEISKGFEPRTMLASGMRLNSKESIKIDGVAGVLMSVSQRTADVEFSKWMVVVGDEKRTLMLLATFPAVLADEFSAPLKKIILAAKIDDSAVKTAQPKVGFSITPSPTLKPFPAATAMGKALAYSIGGKAHPEDPGSPIFIASPDVSERAIRDRLAFATKRMTQQTRKTNVSKILWTKPIKIDGLDGFESFAEAQHGEAALPLVIYQVVLFTDSSYYVLQGRVNADGSKEWLPVFQAMARSFKRDPKPAPVPSDTK